MAYRQQDNGLTARQDRFAQCLAIGMDQAAAYRKCFPTRGRSDNAIHQAAHRIAKKTAVRVRVESFLKEAKFADLQTVGEWGQDLLDMIAMAKTDKNWTACAALKRLSGQALGTLTDTVMVRAEQSMTDETLAKQIAKGDKAKEATLLAILGGKKAA